MFSNWIRLYAKYVSKTIAEAQIARSTHDRRVDGVTLGSLGLALTNSGRFRSTL